MIHDTKRRKFPELENKTSKIKIELFVPRITSHPVPISGNFRFSLSLFTSFHLTFV